MQEPPPAVPQQFVHVPSSRPGSPIVDFIRQIDALEAENAAYAFVEDREHIPLTCHPGGPECPCPAARSNGI